jgi:ATP-dependent DNA helicase RecG
MFMTDIESLQHFLLLGEGQHIEFKESFGREVIESLVALANADGGQVVVGVNNSGAVTGVSLSVESVQQWINQIKSVTVPAIIPDAEVVRYQGKQVVIFKVISFPVKPVSCKGKYYIRRHASNHLMGLDEIADEHLKTINLSWDFTVTQDRSLKDISLDKVNQFVEQANALREFPITDDPLTVLRKFELVREQGITFGCFLLFTGSDTLLTTIDAGRFDSETIIRDSITIRSDLFAELEAVLEFIKKHISKRFVITGKPQRDEVWEYPLEAVREIVLNMIVHRDYRAAYDSTIKIHSDKIEFFNPAELPASITIESILSGANPSMPRNKQIASIFREAGLIEKYGSGIRRVLQAMHKVDGRVPIFECSRGFFKVTLFPMGTIPHDTPHDTPHVTPHVKELLSVCIVPSNREQLQISLGIKDRKYFYKAYLNPALKSGFVEYTIPDKPKSKLQQYRLTELGWKSIENQ